MFRKILVLTTLIGLLSLISTSAYAKKVVSCGQNSSSISFGVDALRMYPGLGVELDGPTLVLAGEFGLPCLKFGTTSRYALKRSDLGDGFDPSIGLNVVFFELVRLDSIFEYWNYAPLFSKGTSDLGTGDIFVLNNALTVPVSFGKNNEYTFTHIFSVYYYSPNSWNVLLDADDGVQLRGELRYNWRPDEILDIFASGGVLYSPHRTLTFDNGVTGAIELGLRVRLHKYLTMSFVGNMWIQQTGRMDGPPVQNIITPIGVVTVDPREEREQLSGTARLMFHVPVPNITKLFD